MLKQSSFNLTVPRGKVFFGRFDSNGQSVISWTDLGNCPGFELSPVSKSVTSYDSVNGVLVADNQYSVEEGLTANLTTDDLGRNNVELFFGGASVDNSVEASGPRVQVFDFGNSIYFLDEIPDSQVKIVDNLGRNWVAGVHYAFHRQFGLIEILSNNDRRAQNFSVYFFVFEKSRIANRKSVGSVRNVEGELRFFSTNPVGPRYHYVFPRVDIRPSDSFSLTGDAASPSWSKVSLQITVLRKIGSTTLFEYREVNNIAILHDGALTTDGISVYTNETW